MSSIFEKICLENFGKISEKCLKKRPLYLETLDKIQKKKFAKRCKRFWRFCEEIRKEFVEPFGKYLRKRWREIEKIFRKYYNTFSGKF